jgi:hypothetical protein
VAQRPDGKAATTERVTFTRPAAERIAKVVREVEQGDRDTVGLSFGYRAAGGGAKAFRICTFTGAWSINATKTVTFRNVTTTPNTATALNLFAFVQGSTSSAATKNCAIAREGTAWYLIAAEC